MSNASKRIFWLASFPKSGNTWFRIVLANLLNKSASPIDLNQISTGVMAACRWAFDEALGFDSSILTEDEVDALRPAWYRWRSANANEPLYIKSHDAYEKSLIPSDVSMGAIYFVRNPLDVAVSFSNHNQSSLDKAIDQMANEELTFCGGRHREYDQLRQRLLSWSSNVTSWTTHSEIPVLTLRYEDMKQDTMATFWKAIQFLKMDVTQDELARALGHSTIETLQKQEAESGFKERPPGAKRFFRKGIVGDWRNELTPSQVERIVSRHGEAMKKFGYL